jgi:2-polyprenyl-6-methoxyphenol hydroxylase-like FAD-dependent oxidoreductase
VGVTVLEKHADFLRDFRGDTIHPSTMEALGELGLLEAFLQLPHQEVEYAELEIGGERVRAADFTRLPTRCKFIALIPQWDFLNFIAAKAEGFTDFRLMMETEAIDLVRQGDRVAGVLARSPSGELELRADLVVAADGRHSVLRRAAGLQVKDLGAPMDVLWFKLPRRQEPHGAVLGRIAAGQALIMLDRGDYWQCALIIRKGSADAVKAGGLEAFRIRIARLSGLDAAHSIASLDDVRLLTVKVDRLETWHKPGLLCIGDAAHAMSPIAGVGINLAIQDAIAAAKHSRRAAAAWGCDRGRPAQGPEAARLPDLGDTGVSDHGPESHRRPGSQQLRDTEAPLARAAHAAALEAPAGYPGAAGRCRISSRACGPEGDRWPALSGGYASIQPHIDHARWRCDLHPSPSKTTGGPAWRKGDASQARWSW